MQSDFSTRESALQKLSIIPMGSRPIENSPIIRLDNIPLGTPAQCIAYNLREKEVQEFCSRIKLPEPLVLLVEDSDVPNIVIGILGPDNYQRHDEIEIVYGRRWRIEPNLSHSELLQTVLLACKVAVEHELRERVQVRGTTPFNAHQDHEIFSKFIKNNQIRNPRNPIRPSDLVIDQRRIIIHKSEEISNNLEVINFEIPGEITGTLPFLQGGFNVLVEENEDRCLKIWDKLLLESKLWLHENIFLDDVAVFSRQYDTNMRIFYSLLHRNDTNLDSSEESIVERGLMNEAIDVMRAPVINSGKTNDAGMGYIRKINPTHGFWPFEKR